MIADFDRSVALLVLKIGHYPLGYSGLGAIRSLGRVGVRTYAVCEDDHTPMAVSRYLTRALVAPTSGREDEETLVATMRRTVDALAGPAVVVVTDDEAAIVLAEHRAELGDGILVPEVEASLPRRLASKHGLYEICHALDFPTPRTVYPESKGEVEAFAAGAQFPVVVKNADPFSRLREPAVGNSTVVETPEDLLTRTREHSEPPGMVIQEYIPDAVGEDWIFHGYFGSDSECLVGFTGVKYRSWPPGGGVTTYARSVGNESLERAVCDLARRLGYRGILDLDLRFDRRDGRYKLLDFNPRIGAQFRLFQTDAGIDVVRAQHLHLTGREVPPGCPVPGRGFVVEHLDAAALAARPRVRRAHGAVRHPPGRIEPAWFARDDLRPFAAMMPRALSLLFRRLRRGWLSWFSKR